MWYFANHINYKQDEKMKEWLYHINTNVKQMKQLQKEVGELKEEREDIYLNSNKYSYLNDNEIQNETANKAIVLVEKYGTTIEDMERKIDDLDWDIKLKAQMIHDAWKAGAIDEMQHEIIIKFYICCMNYETIAKRLGYCENSISRKKTKAVKALDDYYEGNI